MQEQLAASAARQRGVSNYTKISPLAGKLIDDTGDRFTPSHSNKNGARLRYYIPNRLISGKKQDEATMDRGWRLPAPMLESQLGNAVVRHLIDRLPIDLSVSPSVGEIEQVQRRLETMTSHTEHHLPALLKSIDLATITRGKIDVVLIDRWIAEMLKCILTGSTRML